MLRGTSSSIFSLSTVFGRTWKTTTDTIEVGRGNEDAASPLRQTQASSDESPRAPAEPHPPSSFRRQYPPDVGSLYPNTKTVPSTGCCSTTTSSVAYVVHPMGSDRRSETAGTSTIVNTCAREWVGWGDTLGMRARPRWDR